MQTEENLKKSGRMADLVLVYRQRNDVGEDDETTMTDMLADIIHWCDTYGVDFELILDRAQRHYDAESSGEE